MSGRSERVVCRLVSVLLPPGCINVKVLMSPSQPLLTFGYYLPACLMLLSFVALILPVFMLFYIMYVCYLHLADRLSCELAVF